MALITWNDSFSVGVRALDEQHKGLIQTLNELHDAMVQGLARQVTGPLLERLAKYTHQHFFAEEAMMKRTGYPKLASHQEIHLDLTRQVEDYVARFRTGDLSLSVHLIEFLREWLTTHIQKEDRDYGPWLNQHGVT